MRAPSRAKRSGARRKSTTSRTSATASSHPATSANETPVELGSCQRICERRRARSGFSRSTSPKRSARSLKKAARGGASEAVAFRTPASRTLIATRSARRASATTM